MPDGNSLADNVYSHILRGLIQRTLEPGDILDRKALAQELGVSASPVSQAIARLESEGFLEILPRRITRVRLVRAEDFRAQMLIRNALECQASRIYCGQPVRAAESVLLGLAEAVDATRDGPTINWTAEIAFHRALVELIDSPGFLREFDRIMRLGHYVLVSTFSEHNPFPLDPSRSWHRDLVHDLQTDDPDQAEAALRAHLEAGREKFLHAPGSGVVR